MFESIKVTTGKNGVLTDWSLVVDGEVFCYGRFIAVRADKPKFRSGHKSYLVSC